jgi:hypothetical protein
MESMSFAQRKQLLLTAWTASVMIAGVILTIDKPNLWLPVLSLALIPTAIASWLWNAPEPTLSQLIAVARSRS